ncbi:MAG: chemotaxis-specific protein-glutamate methyltransferase CheB [Cyanobacteria bacterium J06636_16]
MSIRVLLVEDSPIALSILKRMLESSPEIEIVGTATTGVEALAILAHIRPDVMCTDFFMPHMNGLELTSQVMTHNPLPILVISGSVQEDDSQRIFQLLEAGAVDVCPKPIVGLSAQNSVFKQSLIDKVKVLSGVKVFRKKRSLFLKRQNSNGTTPQVPETIPSYRPRIVAVGASTGGPMALQELLGQLPREFPLPIVCVQHISSGFLEGLISWLETTCRLPIQIAPLGERPQPGTIYFPPERQHLLIDSRGRFLHSQDPPVDGHCPSVTQTFISLAEFYGRRTVGILLTGMGRDGADGMRAIAEAGGLTIAQDEATSVVFGMPKEAIALGAARHILPIQSITPTLLKLVQACAPNSIR